MGVVPVHPPRVLPGGVAEVLPSDPKGVVPKSTTFRRRSSGRGTSAAAASPGEKKGKRENEQDASRLPQAGDARRGDSRTARADCGVRRRHHECHLGLYLKHGEATDLNVWIDFTLRKE